jgi:ATP-dependent DNA helicase RecG
MDIEFLLTQPESKTLEFKRDLSSLKPILKTIIAFANTAGGVIIIGHSPEKGLIGLEDVLHAEESLTNSITDNISPSILPEIDIKSIKGKDILIVKVAHQKGPYYLKSEGHIGGVYIRFGSSSRKSGPDILADLLRHNNNLSFDQLPCTDLETDDLDSDKLAQFKESLGKPGDDISLFKTLEILVPLSGKMVPTNGGVILFGNDYVRQRYFPDARISCARFKGLDKSLFLDRQDIEGSLLTALDPTLRFISRNTRLAGIIRSLKREDIPEFPEVPLREVIVNAIVHGNYALPGRILVAIYDDRLEVQSPGMLPYGVTLDDFKSGVSRIRNRVIARIFRELDYIEEWGSGYRRITNYCKENGYPIPEWQEFGSAVRVIFYPHVSFSEQLSSDSFASTDLKLSSRQLEILDILSNRGEMKMKEILENLKLPPAERTLRDDLATLKNKDFISFKGHGRSAVWYLLKLN